MPRRLNGTKMDVQQAMAVLLHNQATFVTEMAKANRRYEELSARTERRFAAIERDLNEIKRVLYELPEAIRQKIGFKTK